MDKASLNDYYEHVAKLRASLDWMLKAGVVGRKRVQCLIVGLRPMHAYDPETTGTAPVVSGTVAKADECPHVLQEQTAIMLEAKAEELIRAGFKRMLDQAVEIGEEAQVDPKVMEDDLKPFRHMLGAEDDESSIVYCHNDGDHPIPYKIKGHMVPRCSVCGMAEYADGFKRLHRSMLQA